MKWSTVWWKSQRKRMSIHFIYPTEDIFSLTTAHAFSVWFFYWLCVNVRPLNSVALFYSCRLRRRRDYEGTQRYGEIKEKKSKEDKEMQNKPPEKENLIKEGKLHLCTLQKRKLPRVIVETGREKTPRQSEKWKRLEDRDIREKRCFICGREGHIKKECPQYKGVAGMKLIKLSTLNSTYGLFFLFFFFLYF